MTYPRLLGLLLVLLNLHLLRNLSSAYFALPFLVYGVLFIRVAAGRQRRP